MPGVSAIVFGAKLLQKKDVEGKRVIDVGSCDFNGSIAPLIRSWNPREYVGVDIIQGPNVDLICSADDLISKFGKNSFDIVLSIEMLEHSPNWRCSIDNIKGICKPGGMIVLTTRSRGYPCHGFPDDYWRFEGEDMRKIFSDCEIVELETDYQAPGIFVAARKPTTFHCLDLEDFPVYSMLTGQRITKIDQRCYSSWYFKRLALKQRIRRFAEWGMLAAGRVVTKLLRIDSASK